jgi:histidinol-phosphate aminotransferase
MHARSGQLRRCTEALAAELRALGVRTFPTHAHFFFADFAPHDAAEIADRLRSRDIVIKPFQDPMLGPGYMRITTALPDDNCRFVAAPREMLSHA